MTSPLANSDSNQHSDIHIVALTEAGHQLANLLVKKMKASKIEGAEQVVDVWYKPKPFAEKVQQAFVRGDRLIFICATGIVVRTLAPVLQDKHNDPAILILDEMGKFVIPLLSGHEGGANDWARQISELIKAQLVMTTANPYLKPIYTVGMGCERNCPLEYLSELLNQCLSQAGLTLEQVHSISSIDIKADEIHLIELAKNLNKPFITWNKSDLATVESQLSIRSDYIFETVGVYGVAESAALYSAQSETKQTAELVLNKHKNAKATCAIARSYPGIS
ncbi:MAG: cobalt-precorrin 5A hydrolase [Oleispira sp.]|jgi:cobalt-precorrin 5A hydrolase